MTNEMLLDSAPDTEVMMGWTQDIVDEGIRQPGHPGDRRTEKYIAEKFKLFGLEDVHGERVDVMYWEAKQALLVAGGLEIEGSPLPHTGSADGLTLPLRRATASDLSGSIAVRTVDFPLLKYAEILHPENPLDEPTGYFDPEGVLETMEQVLPFTDELQDIMRSSEWKGAEAFVGALGANHQNSHRYYLPYDGIYRPTPGMWTTPEDGDRLYDLMDSDPNETEGKLWIASERRPTQCENIIGTLPGNSDHWVIIGTHHDAPWASAVEDASGIAMVMAQAKMWAEVPQDQRPHNLLFLVTAAHMAGGAGTQRFISEHQSRLANTVLEVHLEHAAAASAVEDGRLVPLPDPEVRWWFTTEHPHLRQSVPGALEHENLGRSIVLKPDAFMEHPPTDGGFFHLEGVPEVNFLTAPRYLLDAEDTIEFVHQPSLRPITRAVARMIMDTTGLTPASLRAA